MRHGAWVAGRGILAATCLLAATVTADVARAQDIVIDGETITANDIDQRSKLDQLSTHKTPSREQVIEELRREARTLREAARQGIEVTDAEVDHAYANMAARVHSTADQLTRALAQQGIDARTLKRRIRAELAWAQFLRKSKGLASSANSGPRFIPSFGPEWCRQCLPNNDALYRRK